MSNRKAVLIMPVPNFFNVRLMLISFNGTVTYRMGFEPNLDYFVFPGNKSGDKDY